MEPHYAAALSRRKHRMNDEGRRSRGLKPRTSHMGGKVNEALTIAERLTQIPLSLIVLLKVGSSE